MPFVRLSASVREVNKRFYVYFYDPTRTPKRKSFALGPAITTRRRAEQRKRELLEMALAGDFDPWTHRHGDVASRDAPTLLSLLAHFEQERADLRPKTIACYGGAVRGLEQRCPPGLLLDHLDAALVRSYVFDPAVSDATRTHRYRHLRAFFNWAIESGHMKRSPLEGVRPPRSGRREAAYFSAEDFARLVAAVRSEDERGRAVGWIWRAILLGLLTGMRRGELCALRWRHVTTGTDGHITIRSGNGFRTKSGHERRIPVTGPLRELLEQIREATSAEAEVTPDDHVLRGARGGPLDPGTFTRTVKGLLRTAGLPGDLHLHSLRHTHASWLVMGGTHLVAVGKLLGHSSVQVTQRYSHIGDASLRHDLEKVFSGLPAGSSVREVENGYQARSSNPET